MCLYLWNQLRLGCPKCDTSLAGVVLAPISAILGLVVGLVLGLVKWLPGSATRIYRGFQDYCNVISAGQERYDVEAGRRREVEEPREAPATSLTEVFGRKVERKMHNSGSKCAAECYCCCCPVYFLCLLLSPILVLFDLIFCVALFNGACAGYAAGCGNCSGFGHRVYMHFKTLDRLSSSAAFYETSSCRLFGIDETSSQPQHSQPTSETADYNAPYNAKPQQPPPVVVAEPVYE